MESRVRSVPSFAETSRSKSYRPGSSSQATSQSTPSTSQTINAAMMQGKERSHLAVVFFDLLYLNGKSYLQGALNPPLAWMH